MKKVLYIVAIVALALCNFYFIESDKDFSKISLNSIVNMAQAQTEGPEGWYRIQVCYSCEPLPGQAGAEWECWLFWGDISKGQSCFDLSCSYGFC